MNWKKSGKMALGSMAAAALLLSVSACGEGDTDTRQVVEKAGTRITVMDNTSEPVYTKLKLEGIDRIEGMRAMDFVSEDILVVDQENRKLPPETVEGVERYPRNLYLHNLSSGSRTPLLEGERNYGAAQLSPDKKHLFYKEVYESTGIGYLMNLDTGASVKADEAEFRTEEGEWADNEHVIFPDMEGSIRRTDVNGVQQTVFKPGPPYVHEVVQSGSTIYYVTGEDSQLAAYDTSTKQAKNLNKNVLWVIPSPDGSKLAIVKRTRPGEMVLVLCDAEGSELSTLASGQQVFGTSWSPDGSKLAYAMTSENAAEDQDGLFISEVETGEQTPVLADIQAADQLRWSPSGKKLLASTSVLQDNAYRAITYVIRLS